MKKIENPIWIVLVCVDSTPRGALFPFKMASLPLPSTFYLATVEYVKHAESRVKIFTSLSDVSAFLTSTIREFWDDSVNGADDSEYIQTLALCSEMNLVRTGGNIRHFFSEYEIVCSVHTPHSLMSQVLKVLPEIGTRLHHSH